MVTMLSAILHSWRAMTWNAEVFIITILILCRLTMAFARETFVRMMQQQSDRYIAEDSLAIVLEPARVGSGGSK